MNPELDLDAAAAWVDDWQASIERRAAQAKELNEAVQGLTAAGRDRSQTVEVTITASGAVADVWLSERVRQQAVADTRSQLLEAFGAASLALHRRVAQTTTEVLGDDNPLATALLASLARRVEPGAGHAPAR